MKKIKWGIMGTAYICERSTFQGMMLAKNCEMYAIAGRNIKKAEMFKEKYGFYKAYGSYEELLEDEEVEAIYIPLPNTMHYEWTVRALKKKKHVLCEKPIAPTMKQTEEMFEEAEKNNVCLMESAYITSDYNMNNIRMRKEMLGGCTYDLGVYNTSLILRILGEKPQKIKAISSGVKDEIDNYVSVIFEYNDGKMAAFSSGMVLETEENRHIDRFEIHGSEGIIKGIGFEFNGDGELSYSVKRAGEKEVIKTVQVPQNYCLEVEQFGRCVEGKEKPAVSREFSIINAGIIDDILKKIEY